MSVLENNKINYKERKRIYKNWNVKESCGGGNVNDGEDVI